MDSEGLLNANEVRLVDDCSCDPSPLTDGSPSATSQRASKENDLGRVTGRLAGETDSRSFAASSSSWFLALSGGWSAAGVRVTFTIVIL